MIFFFRYEWQYDIGQPDVTFYHMSKSRSSKFVRDMSSTMNNFIKYNDLKRLTSRISYKNKWPVIRIESVCRTKQK